MPGLFFIPLSGIKEGHHIFEFEINKKFFDLFEESEIKDGELSAACNVFKSSTHIDLDISIKGYVKICCDRCLELFNHPVNCKNRLLIKFGTEKDDSDTEIITVPRDEHEFDMKQYLYEFIHLALPIKRIHPDNIDGSSKCDPVMLRKLNEHLVEEDTDNDPRWNELKKLMTDN